MKDISDGFTAGTLRHDLPEHVCAQLSLEGKRRLDGLFFERLVQRRLLAVQAESPDLVISFGWYIGYDKARKPAYWFRLQKQPGDWNACDEAVARNLTGQFGDAVGGSVRIVQVTFDHERNRFLGQIYGEDRSVAGIPLPEILNTLPNKKTACSPRSMGETAGLDAPALSRFAGMDSDELAWLSIQRRFINCVLAPALGTDPADIDAFVLNGRQELRQVEFKRKYPSRAGDLTIDEHPHVQTVTLMTRLGIVPLLVLLIAPYWTKNGEPVLWLEVKGTYARWTWIAAVLGGEGTYGDGTLHTEGDDSGQRAQERIQWPVHWNRFRLLHAGLKLGQQGGNRLQVLLRDGNTQTLPDVNVQYLREKQVPMGRNS